MCYTQIDSEIKETYFAFFYKFSRFEYCLKKYFLDKENDSLNKCWKSFVCKFSNCYIISPAAKELLSNPPNKLSFKNGDSVWNCVSTTDCFSKMDQVVYMLTTVRNNLFHGDKHGDIDNGSVQRNLELIRTGISVLDDLAKLAGFVDDYNVAIKE